MPDDKKLLAQLSGLPPEEAVKYMQARSLLTKTFSWQDLWQEEHATQFTVSRLARLDLVQAVYDGVAASVNGDMGRRDFMRGIQDILVSEGWWGEKSVIDPKTGELLTTTFDANRLKLIYDVNTRQAYSAGRWQRIERNKATSPYIRYITKRDERVRDSHKSWDNLTLPVDHPFWHTHFPPNGWRCRCRAMSMSQADYDNGLAPNGQPLNKVEPDIQFKDWVNKKTGETMRVPVGIDPGFGYNPGKSGARKAALDSIQAEKIAAAAAPIRVAAENDFLNDPVKIEPVNFVETALRDKRAKQKPLVLEPVSDLAIAQAVSIGVNLREKQLALDHDGVIHTIKQHGGKKERLRGQEPVTPEDIAMFGFLFNRAKTQRGNPENARDGTDLIEGTVIFGEYEFTLIAKVRRQHVVPYTMHKRKVK